MLVRFAASIADRPPLRRHQTLLGPAAIDAAARAMSRRKAPSSIHDQQVAGERNLNMHQPSSAPSVAPTRRSRARQQESRPSEARRGRLMRPYIPHLSTPVRRQRLTILCHPRKLMIHAAIDFLQPGDIWWCRDGVVDDGMFCDLLAVPSRAHGAAGWSSTRVRDVRSPAMTVRWRRRSPLRGR